MVRGGRENERTFHKSKSRPTAQVAGVTCLTRLLTFHLNGGIRSVACTGECFTQDSPERVLVILSASCRQLPTSGLICFVRGGYPLSTTAREMSRPPPKDPLVWVDCEMTGLDLPKDRILEIAVCFPYCALVRDLCSSQVQIIITDGDLNPVDEGIEYVIRTDKDALDGYVFQAPHSLRRPYALYNTDELIQ